MGGEKRAVEGSGNRKQVLVFGWVTAPPRQGLRLGAGGMESVAICTALLANQPSLWRGC